MTEQQRNNLEKMGGRVTDVGEFLGLSDAETWLIDFKIDLGEAIRARRIEADFTRSQVADSLGLTAERFIALEEGGPNVSLDAQMLALRVLGATNALLQELLAVEFSDTQISDKEALAT